jgi:hypothetical protein
LQRTTNVNVPRWTRAFPGRVVAPVRGNTTSALMARMVHAGFGAATTTAVCVELAGCPAPAGFDAISTRRIV